MTLYWEIMLIKGYLLTLSNESRTCKKILRINWSKAWIYGNMKADYYCYWYKHAATNNKLMCCVFSVNYGFSNLNINLTYSLSLRRFFSFSLFTIKNFASSKRKHCNGEKNFQDKKCSKICFKDDIRRYMSIFADFSKIFFRACVCMCVCVCVCV